MHALGVAALYRQESEPAFHCHSERSEESKGFHPKTAQFCEQWLGILRRFTPQNDKRRAPLCHSEPFGYAQGKLREESKASDHSALRSTDPGFSVSMHSLWVSFVRMYTLYSHNGLGFFVASLLRMTEAARPCHSEPFGYAQGKLREESKASDHPALRSTHPGFSDSTCSQWVSFVRM